LNLVELASSKYQVVAVMDGDICPAIDFLVCGEATTESSRNGLVEMLDAVSAMGLQGVPSAWLHEANKQLGIYEFVKGRLRLFFFKGVSGQIAVCTTGVMKSGQKADKASVKRAAEFRDLYFAAHAANTLKVVDYGTE